VLALTLAGELGLAWYVLDASGAGFAFDSHRSRESAYSLGTLPGERTRRNVD
jgi:hypothetical protein